MSPILSDPQPRATSKRITIDPITRLEGHGKIEIFLNDEGNVANAYWQVPELRGFEKFCIGRSVDELNKITSRLCGVCPGAHHLCSTKALGRRLRATPPETAVKLRELFYSGALRAQPHRALLCTGGRGLRPRARRPGGEEEHPRRGRTRSAWRSAPEVIKHRSYAQKIQEMLGGKATHPVCGIPGGMSKPHQRGRDARRSRPWPKSCVEFSQVHHAALRGRRAEEPGLHEHHRQQGHLLQRDLQPRDRRQERQGQLLRRNAEDDRPERQGGRPVYWKGLPEVHRRAHPALVATRSSATSSRSAGRDSSMGRTRGIYRATPLSQAQRLEGLHHPAGAG